MTAQETFNNFILSRRLADFSPKTVLNYKQFVAPFINAIGPESDFQNLTQTDISTYISNLLSRSVSRATKATYIRHIKAFLHWAQEEYGAQFSYKAVKVPKTPKKEVRIYSEKEINAIFQAMACSIEWITKRNMTIVAMMYDSGLRQSEVCELRRSWLSPDEGRMKVHGKGDKERTVPMGALTQKLLQSYFDACPYESEFVFVSRNGLPLTGDAVKHMITKAASRLNFELSSHKLRHNFATNYCIDQYTEYGRVDIYSLMHIMGHEDLSTTQRYLHYAQEILASRTHVSHLDKLSLTF